MRPLPRLAFPALFLFAVACDGGSTIDPVDVDAENSTGVSLGKADSLALAGQFEASPSSWASGDIADLAFITSKVGVTSYVRLRCYHAGCALALPETDAIKVVRSSGRTYLQFMSEKITVDKMGNTTSAPAVADMYEYRAVGQGFKLRKTLTTRWLSYAAVSDHALCDGSGGTWSDAGASCDCQPAGAGYGFIAGAGGCNYMAVSSEAACDGTHGLYTDDDATPIGTYCKCGLGRYMTDSGCTKI